MNSSDKRIFWQGFFDRIETDSETVAPARVADLDSFERSTGFIFPQRYREFAEVFGIGDLQVFNDSGGRRDYSIAIPGTVLDPTDLTANFRESCDETDMAERYGDAALAMRLIMFCDHQENGNFGWDPLEVTDSADHEYAIYLIDWDGPTRRIASTFTEFVLNTCFERRLGTEESPDPTASQKMPEDADIEELPYISFSPVHSPGVDE